MNHPELPKVLVPANGRPIVSYVLDTLHQVGVEHPVIIVKYKADHVRQELGDQEYVEQGDLVGTGAAALAAQSVLGKTDGLIYIANGDCPCFSLETYRALAAALTDPMVAVAIATSSVSSIADKYGRVLRTKDDSVGRIVEYKDATDEERAINEFNAGLYLVRSPWLWSALERIRPSAVSGEYYLTDIVALANQDGCKVVPVSVIHPNEAQGVNTPEELLRAEIILSNHRVLA